MHACVLRIHVCHMYIMRMSVAILPQVRKIKDHPLSNVISPLAMFTVAMKILEDVEKIKEFFGMYNLLVTKVHSTARCCL